MSNRTSGKPLDSEKQQRLNILEILNAHLSEEQLMLMLQEKAKVFGGELLFSSGTESSGVIPKDTLPRFVH